VNLADALAVIVPLLRDELVVHANGFISRESFTLSDDGLAPEAREKMETLNGIHSNAAGFRRWLETRSDATEL